MDSGKQKNRIWERHGCLLPCEILPQNWNDQPVPARIINIGRGGVLVESDHEFKPDDKVIIIARQVCDEVDRFEIGQEVHGIVRWGQFDANSLMGLFYVGIEFEDLLPFRQANLANP